MIGHIEAGPQWITRSGEVVRLDRPDLTSVYAEDLFDGLVRQRRWLGALDVTVLQHLALCVVLARDVHGLGPFEVAWCAAHDLHEAYTQDLIRPWKRLVVGDTPIGAILRSMEEAWCDHVHEAIGLTPPPDHAAADPVRFIDARSVAAEVVGERHPHANWYLDRTPGGPPSVGELEAWEGVRILSPRACWDTVELAIRVVTGREIPRRWRR